MSTHRITLLRSAGAPPVTIEILDGATLMRAILRARLPLARSCRGTGICAACRVRIIAGSENLAPPNAVESTLSVREPLRPNERYACQARLHGPLTLTTPYW